ncbi:MAG: ABC-three component system protein [Saprospiraceae bacterium]
MIKKIDQSAEGENVQQAGNDIVNTHINNYNYIQKQLPKHIAKVIIVLDKALDVPDLPPKWNKLIPPKIQEKIDYNDLKTRRILIENYGNYAGIVEAAYETLDNEKPNSKRRFLHSINWKYQELKNKVLVGNEIQNEIELIRANSDQFIDNIVNDLHEEYCDALNKDDGIMGEDILFCIYCIVAKAFIDCKILEPPVI